MLRENMLSKDIEECFADAPVEVRAAVDYVLFSRREHPLRTGYDLVAAVDGSMLAPARVVAQYLRDAGAPVEVPAQTPPQQFFYRLPQ